ncbi:hypothetical protein ZOSMA_40G00280 [Zostera marina]|uniref:BHLH domain-containing protein n=1 Tax=Zostera marina TaxID=29655 RepID=A0A0K9P331_ZOSMR|nr:hypothetical protein ZOSMA_40G00280 [Zostera marina]
MDEYSSVREEFEHWSSTSGGGIADSCHNLGGASRDYWPDELGRLASVQHRRRRSRNLPTPEKDDDEMTKAMIVVLSSPTNTSPSGSTTSSSKVDHGRLGFRQYNSSEKVFGIDQKLKSKVNESRPNSTKLIFSMMRSINDRRVAQLAAASAAAASVQEHHYTKTDNQVHHMISERKRREKLNKSFFALRSELPPRTKKDKASILMATREYLMELKSRISIIKSKNQELENHLSYYGEESTSVKMDINEKQRIEISRNIGLECSISGMQEVNGRILVRIEENWNVIDLVLHILRCLKVMGNINLVSMNHLSATATLVVHIKVESDLDVTNLHKSIEREIDETLKIFNSLV